MVGTEFITWYQLQPKYQIQTMVQVNLWYRSNSGMGEMNSDKYHIDWWWSNIGTGQSVVQVKQWDGWNEQWQISHRLVLVKHWYWSICGTGQTVGWVKWTVTNIRYIGAGRPDYGTGQSVVQVKQWDGWNEQWQISDTLVLVKQTMVEVKHWYRSNSCTGQIYKPQFCIILTWSCILQIGRPSWNGLKVVANTLCGAFCIEAEGQANILYTTPASEKQRELLVLQLISGYVFRCSHDIMKLSHFDWRQI